MFLQDASAYPKEMRVPTRHVQNEAIRKITSTEVLNETQVIFGFLGGGDWGKASL